MRFNTEILGKEKTKAGKTYKVSITHRPMSGPRAGKETTVGNLWPNLSDQAKAKVAELKTGDKVSIEITKTEDGKYWNLTDVGELTNEEPTTKGGGDSNVGVKVGAARNQALAALALASTHASETFKEVKTLQDILNLVDTTATEIVSRQAAQEEAVGNSRNGNSDVVNSIANSDQTNYTDHDDVSDDDIPF